MKTTWFLMLVTGFLLVTVASAQEYFIRVTYSTNLRESYSLDSAVLAAVQAGEIVQVIGEHDNWLKINRNGREMWMAGWLSYSRVEDSEQTTSATGTSAQIDNCCLAGWHCINDEEWTNGLQAHQRNDCEGSPRIPTGESCCQMGWNCTLPSDWIMGVWYIREGLKCGMPNQVNYAGVIIEGSEFFIAQVSEALDLLKSGAPEWYAYVIAAPLKIREWLGSHTLERSVNMALSHAAEDVIRRASTLLHESCHLQRWRVRLHRYETDLQKRTEENLCELVVDDMLDSLQPVRPHNAKLEFEVNRLIAEGVNIHDLANTERQRAIHILSQRQDAGLADWVNYSQDEEGDETASETETSAQIDNCCFAGWNCAFDFDFIMGKWAYDDNDGQCFSPSQVTVDGVIIEGSDEFIDGVSRALRLIKDSSPEWYTLAINGALKIREAPGGVGAGTLERSMNLKPIVAYSPSFSPAGLAAAILMSNCRLYRWLPEAKATYPDWEPLAEEVLCDTATHDALTGIFS